MRRVLKIHLNTIVSLFVVLSFAATLSGQIHTPKGAWEDMSENELAANGFKLESLTAAWKYIKDETPATGMFVAINGKSTIYFGDVEERSYVASVRKSILAIMYGKYIDNGKIDLNRTLKELGVDDIKGLAESEKLATISDLLTARSGIYHPASNTGDDTKYAPERRSVKPGEYFLYNNWDFNAAGAIFEKQTGKDIYKAFYEDLAVPLAMQDFYLNEQRKSGDRKRSQYPAYHFLLSTRDMARLGLLMLNKGNWNNKRLISETWVEQITTPITRNNEMNPDFHRRGPFGYGYMWWVWDGDKTPPGFEGAYLAQGNFGQFIAVLPKLNMVVALKTKDVYARNTTPSMFYTFLKMLVKSHDRYSDKKTR